MAATTILAVGMTNMGSTALRAAHIPQNDSLVLAAIAYGRRLYEVGAPKAACINQHEEAGWDEAAAEADTPAADGTVQAIIDYGAEAQALEDDREDRAFWARGGW